MLLQVEILSNKNALCIKMTLITKKEVKLHEIPQHHVEWSDSRFGNLYPNHYAA